MIELLSKEEIKQIKEFPNDIKNKLIKIMSEKQVDLIMNTIKFNRKEDIKFLTELNKYIKSLNDSKLKIVHLLSWYLVKKEILDKEEIKFSKDYDSKLEYNIHIYLHKIFTGKRYMDEDTPKALKEWLFKTIENALDSGHTSSIFATTLYLDSYNHWLLLIDTLVDILTFNKIVKINGVNE